MNKKKVIFIVLTIIVILGIITGIYLAKRPDKENKVNNNKIAIQRESKEENKTPIEKLTKTEKEIVGIETSEDDKKEEENKKLYSDLYKDYLKLPEEEKEKSEVIPRKIDVPFEKLEEIKENLDKKDSKQENKDDSKKENKQDSKQDNKQNNKQDNKKQTNEKDENLDNKKDDEKDNKLDENKIPEKFNLADKINIKVENQYSYGLCWDFASLKTLETYLALNNLGDYDFSELHVDYITSNLLYGGRDIHQGGSFDVFQDYVIESGVVLEKDVPYSYTKNGLFSLYDYSEEEYSKFPDMKKIMEVTETVEFPSMYKFEGSNHTEEQITDFRNTVKKHIMKNGGLYTQIIGTTEKNYYAAPTTEEWANHAVTIVGWDDNYSKDNFLSSDGKKPSKDGAYIALNSWGEGFNDKGYYYISYEDKFVESNLSGISSTYINEAYRIDTINNPALRKYLEDNYKHSFITYNGKEYITKLVLSEIRTINLSNSKLSSVEGFEIFTNLAFLDLSNNNITDVTPIGNLNSLVTLDLSNNNIIDVTPLAKLDNKKLYSLDLSNNKIKDVSPLTELSGDEWGYLYLNISNNPLVKGYDKLNNICDLDISKCNITDVSFLKEFNKLISLKINNTPGIVGLENLPDEVYNLELSGCNIDKFPKANGLNFLNISNNSITDLSGIENCKYLYKLDISGNHISDWSALKNIKIEENSDEESEEKFEILYNDYYNDYEYEYGIELVANNCNIEDITVFNNLNCLNALCLKNNKIKDVSKFNNKKIYSIDLSNNENITGLQGLNNCYIVFLDNCKISDVSEILKLTNVSQLSLENNAIKNIEVFSNLNNLESLSLSGNKNIKGTIKNDKIYRLNLSDCSLDDSFDFSRMNNIQFLNVAKNSKFDVEKFIKNRKINYMYIEMDELDLDTFNKIMLDEKNTTLNIVTKEVTLNYDLKDGEKEIDLSKYKVLKKELKKSLVKDTVELENGVLDKNGYIINIKDTTKKSVEISFKDYNYTFANSKIKIIINPQTIKNESLNEISNSITNSINENTLNTINQATNTVSKNIVQNQNTSDQNTSVKNTVNQNTSVVNETIEDTSYIDNSTIVNTMVNI